MAAIDELIQQIQDPVLRERIRAEVDDLAKQKKFGLVFENHLPEHTPLYEAPIKVGSLVMPKLKKGDDLFTVKEINGDTVTLISKADGTESEAPLRSVVVAAELGEPIYPYLKYVDSISRAPDDDLWHVLIEADNYHALQLLEYMYAGKVDCIYIDPPYNSGARDWKYNNDYVDGSDSYKHSKWLSMMERRLKIARKLLNPNDSVLIVTIDEKEYLHLGCLLEDLFPTAKMQMISSVINPSGVSRDNEFFRTDEYIFILRFGSCVPAKVPLSDEWITAKTTGKDKLRWRRIRRQGSHDLRSDAPNQFYPIFVTKDGKKYVGCGESLAPDASKDGVLIPPDVIAVWPLKPDGTEGCWQISQTSADDLFRRGYIKITYTKKWGITPQYLAKGEREKVENGQFPIIGYDQYGTIITEDSTVSASFVPGTQWRITSHNAREHGSKMLRRIFGDKPFDFSKSLYAEADVIRFFVANKKNALILDFFAGSGTTLHAVNLLNFEDGGHRQCIIVTNNEVSEQEAKELSHEGLYPGDEKWDKNGIARSVTWPRTVGSITGRTITGEPIKGDYGVDTDIFEREDIATSDEDESRKDEVLYRKRSVPAYPKLRFKHMSDGFSTNAVYFKLGFLDKANIAMGRQFRELIPILWMKSGCHSKCPDLLESEQIPPVLVFPKNRFAVLVNEAYFDDFEKQIAASNSIESIFIVTNSEISYKEMALVFEGKITYQLYRDYLDNFRLNVRK